jgi:ATP-dependent Lon protease
MSVFDGMTHFPDDFSGVVRLFPLADLVFFPHVIQPLHIFEPRYRALLADALAGDRLIAMVLQNGASQANSQPPIESVACVGRIVAHAPEPDGRANILLAGLRRVLIRREVAGSTAYRQAKVTVLEDVYPTEGLANRRGLQRRLIRELQHSLPSQRAVRQQLKEILKAPLRLGALTDILAFSLPWDNVLRQQLLEETDVDCRANWLLDALAAQRSEADAFRSRETAKFPPTFSVN